ncbi:hypothetical protein SASPL_138627 [Salvia splendens]|uniref:CCHC-type domain-containing protein n=1 Tax=Salvia splendens TaxID=180675 RepID=A0A8X8ZEH0_SALSN|nr:uncharacterized protein LOC121763635 isoform X1 [Salvia splendens]KAG6401762.1 hypothetical protein SASPL_138627 [Salvia splendens]
MSNTDGSNTKNTSLDPSHPYYVHHSDQPGHLLVPTKLNGTNYQSWSRSMLHALTAKSKVGFIDGSISPPSQVEDPTIYFLWKQCNSMIISWLTHSVEADIAEGIIHAKTSQQVWEDLRDQFSQKNAPAIYQVQRSIATITQGSSTVAAYYTKIKALWAELDTYRTHVACNQEKLHNEEKEEDRLMQFLMGLNDVFKAARSNILMMNPLPNVRQAYSLVIQEEMQRQVSSDTPENFSIAATVQGKSFPSKNSKEKLCDHCHRSGHIIADCRTLKYHCTFCNKRGHTEDRCRLKNGGGAARYTQGIHRGNTPSAHMADASQQGAGNSLINGISPEYLQQLAQAVSALNKNNQSGNNDVHANAAGLDHEEDDWLG